MLSDSQVDQLERLFWDSTLEEFPSVLGRYLPILFSELRTVRLLYNDRVDDFFSANTTEDSHGGQEEDSRNNPALRGRVLLNIHQENEAGLGGNGDPRSIERSDTDQASQLPSKRGRGRPKGSRSKGKLVARADSEQVGGEILPSGE